MPTDLTSLPPTPAVPAAFDGRDYYSIAEAAALLGVSRVSVWRWIGAGHLPASRLGPRTTRIKRQDLERLLGERQTVGPRAWALQGRGAADGSADGAVAAPRADWRAVDGAKHFVQFYEADAFLLAAVADFIGASLRAGDAGVVIATPAHRVGLEDRLRAEGLDLDGARVDGRYVALDAAEMLARIMVDGAPEPTRFAEVIGGAITRAAAGRRRVRAYGEMVALLADDGRHAAVVRLEELWNDLQQTYSFALFCAYPQECLNGAAGAAALGDICAAHTHVIPAESYSALPTADDRLRAITVLQQQAASLAAEVAQRTEAEALLAGQKQVLEMIATGAPLPDVLAALIRTIEAHSDGLLGSILVRDAEREQFCLGIAPSLPESYIGVLAHAPITPPYLGPCGRATHMGEEVITANVAVDERWSEAWRRLAVSHDLRACYSAPILASDGWVLGAFDMYYREPRDPRPANAQLIATATHLAGIAIERRRAEEVLRASEQRFRRIFEHSNDAVFVMDPAHDAIIDTNARACDLLGYAREELLALPLSAIYPQEMPVLVAFAQAVAAQGQGWTDELTCRTKSGHMVPAEISASPIELDGKAYLLALVRDVSERKRAEALQLVETRVLELVARRTPLPRVLAELARAVEALADGMLASVLLLDEDGRHLRHGAAPSLPDAYNRAIDGIAIGTAVGSCGTAAYRGERVIVVDIAVDPLWVDFRDLGLAHGLHACWSAPIRSAGSRVLGTFALYYRAPRAPRPGDLDLIDRVARVAALAIERAQAETERARLLVREREARAEAEAERQRLLDLERAREEFLSSAAHDLKTPLTGIRGQAQLAQRRLARLDLPQTAPVLDQLTRIQEGADAMVSLINEMVDVTRQQMGGELVLHREPTDLVALVKDCIEIHRDESGRPIHLEIAVSEMCADVDAARVRRVVGNLLSNALKYSPDGSPIAVHLRQEDGAAGPEAALEVRDEGLGIPAADLPHIFERFQRAGNVAGHIQGTGIGLASARDIVEQHGGTIAVESAEGKGSTFTVRLPLHE